MEDPRGEVELDLGSIKFVMRPSFEAQRLIQRELGEGLMALATRVFEGNFGIEEVYVIARHGIAAVPGQEIDEDELGDLLARQGLRKLTTPMLQFLSHILGGWGDEETKTEPASSEPTRLTGAA